MSWSGLFCSGISGVQRRRADLADDVRNELEPFRRASDRHATQLAERRDEPARVLRQQRPGRRLVQTRDVAHHREAKHAVAAAAESQLRKRNAELRAPAILVASRHDLPDGVPTVVVVRIVEPVGILLDANRVHAELIRRPLVVIRVDQHVDPIRRRVGIAPGQEAHDAIRIGIKGVHADVDRRGVKRHARLGPHRPGRAFERLALNECGDRGRLRPGGIAQVAIENDGKSAFADRDGGHLRDWPLRKGRLSTRPSPPLR